MAKHYNVTPEQVHAMAEAAYRFFAGIDQPHQESTSTPETTKPEPELPLFEVREPIHA